MKQKLIEYYKQEIQNLLDKKINQKSYFALSFLGFYVTKNVVIEEEFQVSNIL